MTNVTDIKLSQEELKLLLFFVEVYKERTEEITEDGIMLLSDELVQNTGVSYYQQMMLKKKLEIKNFLKAKYKGLPRKVFYKLNVPFVKEYLEAIGFSGYVDHAVFNS